MDESFEVGGDGYSAKKRRRTESFSNTLDRSFTDDSDEEMGMFVDEMGYNMRACASAAMHENYERMRQAGDAFDYNQLLAAATEQAVTDCGGDRDEIEGFLFERFLLTQNIPNIPQQPLDNPEEEEIENEQDLDETGETVPDDAPPPQFNANDTEELFPALDMDDTGDTQPDNIEFNPEEFQAQDMGHQGTSDEDYEDDDDWLENNLTPPNNVNNVDSQSYELSPMF